MRSYVGIGKGNVKDAVRDAVNGIGNPSAIIFLSSFSQIRETAEILAQKFQGIPCIGTLGTKLANGEYGDDSLVVLGLYDDAKTECGVIRDISLCPVAAIGEINEKVNRVSPGRENTVCIEFCTNDEEKLVTTFNSCLEKRGVKLAGGTVFGVPDGKKPVVAYNGRVFEDACVYAIIKNTTGKVGVFKENIYEKKTDKYHLNGSDRLLIITASALHDIGKIGISDRILNKAGKLTEEEFEVIKRHPIIGASILKNLALHQDEPIVKVAYEICRWHHERYDGGGYPDGLKGEQIPISAQIVSLADVYDALVSDRIYKKAYSHKEAVRMILAGECGAFNPLLLECLEEIQGKIKEELEVQDVPEISPVPVQCPISEISELSMPEDKK